MEETISGGLSYSFNKPLIPAGALPSGRGGASVSYADGKLIVFGGHYAREGGFDYLDETWVLDIEKLMWHKINCSGQIPSARYGHSSQVIGTRMFVFGGRGAKGAVFKDVYFLDLIEWIWVPVKAISTGPDSRFFHASEVVGKRIVIHGGWNGESVFNDIWIFNTDSFSWMQPRTAGFGPTPRYGHSLTLAPDGRLFIIGGTSLDKDSNIPKYIDDIRVLDTDTMIWTRPRVEGFPPTGRYGHTATYLEDGKIVVYGGWGSGGCQCKEFVSNTRAHTLQILDINQLQWLVPRRFGRKEVKHLYNHGASKMGNSIVAFGGFDGRQSNCDFLVINIDEASS